MHNFNFFIKFQNIDCHFIAEYNIMGCRKQIVLDNTSFTLLEPQIRHSWLTKYAYCTVNALQCSFLFSLHKRNIWFCVIYITSPYIKESIIVVNLFSFAG